MQQVSGQQVSGQQVSGQQVSGQQVSGQQVSGQQVSGQQVNWESEDECLFKLDNGDLCIALKDTLYSISTANEYKEGVGHRYSEDEANKIMESFSEEAFKLFRENHMDLTRKSGYVEAEPLVYEALPMPYVRPQKYNRRYRMKPVGGLQYKSRS